MATDHFKKRIYTLASFNQAIRDAFAHLDEFISANRSGRISKPFSERIMLAVTQVNGCRYCQYGHARMALSVGVPQEHIRQLAAGEWNDLPEVELPALFFSQHYAETSAQPDPEAWQTLVDTYGAPMAQDILAHIRMIMIGNLSGNTLDAFLSRLAFRPAPGSKWWDELGVLLGAFVLIPYHALRWRSVRARKQRAAIVT